MTVDLYEGKNLNQVVQNIITVKRELGFGFQKQAPVAAGGAASAIELFDKDDSTSTKITTLLPEPQAFEHTLSRFVLPFLSLLSPLPSPFCLVTIVFMAFIHPFLLTNRTGAALRPGQGELTDKLLTPTCQVCLKRITTTFVNACGISWHTQVRTQPKSKVETSECNQDRGKERKELVKRKRTG
jgi:hypothetical protein